MAMQGMARFCGAALLLGASLGASAAVVDLMPGALTEYLKDHQDVVVQFTSPDPLCSFCVGADRAFDRLEQRFGDRITFVRVQWMPWRNIPQELKKEFRLVGLPLQICIRHGKAVDRYIGAPREPLPKGFNHECFDVESSAESIEHAQGNAQCGGEAARSC